MTRHLCRPSVELVKTALDETWQIYNVWIRLDGAEQSAILASDLRAQNMISW